MKLKKYIIAVSFITGLVSAQADLISYDLSLLDTTTDGTPFDTRGTYPDTYAGGLIVMDPSDDAGRMDRMLYVGFGDTASNGDRRKIQRYTGNLYTREYSKGFTGSDVLTTTGHSDSHSQFKNSGTIYYNPVDTIFWIGRTKDDEFRNQTSFNDMAYGFKVTDNGNGFADAGDVLELVGIVYSTGSDSVFGQTADELTGMLSFSRIAQLEAQVAALPAATLEDGVKRAILELALERAEYALDVFLYTEAQSLIDDVEAALAQSAADFAQRNPAADNLAILKPLLTATNNPYLDAMVLEANEALATTDVVWSRATAGNPAFSGLNGSYGVRAAPELARTFFWLFAHEQSPMRYDPELLKRVLRRAHAYVDAINLDPAGDIEAPVVMDQFCVEAAFPLLFEIHELHPGLLLPSEELVWDNAMIAATTEMYTWGQMAEGYSPWNYNIETARMVGALNVGLYTGNQTFIDRALAHVDKVLLLMRPDGAVPYHGEGNPSVNYHNALYGSWLKIYEQTGYEPITAALEASQWKGPVMGRTDEFWTSPHYKAYRWNFQKGTEVGPEAVAALSGNPYLRWMLDNGGTTGVDRDQVAWYDASILSGPLPDNYTIPDRNVGGPRAWYGEFCYAGAFRPNPAGMEGRETLMGAMTVDPADGRLNSILADATPRIWMSPDAYLNENGQEVSALGVLTANEVAATTITRNYSVGTSVHDITATQGGAYQGPFSEWKGRQIWLGLPDRILGLVSTVPSVDGAEAYAVNGVVRLISGGSTGAETTKVLTTVGPGHYRYGQLDILVHDSTYTSLNGFEVEYRKAEYPATELTFSDRASEPAAVGALNSYPTNTDFRFVIEVRPSWTTTDLTSVSVLGDQQVVGLEVVGTDRSFQVWLNTTDSNRQVTIERNNLPAVDDSLTLSDGVLGTAPFDHVIPGQVTLLPGQHCVLVVSSDPADHEPGWESFESMVFLLSQSAYDTWASGFGLSGPDAADDFDYDDDGLVNLGEYAFGGSPIDGSDLGVQPWLEGNLKYVFELVDNTSLTYAVITTTDLVNGGGSIPVTLDGSGDSATREGFKRYTNTVDTTANDAGFLSLEVSN